MNQQALSAFIWSVADLLRGDYKQSEYGRVILPLTVLRRLDCVLEPTKAAVLAELADKQKAGVNPEPFLLRKAGQSFCNTSPLDMKTLMGDQDHIRENLFSYVRAFSPAVRDIFEHFEFHAQIERLAKTGLLYQVVERFVQVDLHPDEVDNHQMGLVFEELIRRFAELSNETAGEHFTPREVIRLMVNLLFIEDEEVLSNASVVRTIYDPAAGTGGMLSTAGEYLAEIIAKVNALFEGDLTDNDKLVYVNDVLKTKLMESDVLAEQAGNNSKEQFANSPDLATALLDAIMDSYKAHTTMSKQALSSDKIRDGLRQVLLGPGRLYESLRSSYYASAPAAFAEHQTVRTRRPPPPR